MGQKIERDHQRFRKIVRGKVKSEPVEVHQPRRDDRQEGQGPRVSIPLPQIEISAVPLRPEGLRRRRRQGEGQPGQPLGAGRRATASRRPATSRAGTSSKSN